MDKKNVIGLDHDKAKKIGIKLNTLLASYSIFYQNTRNYHWNIKGENFFELHIKFEELYTDLFEKIDEIAERILTLGYTPLHNYSDYFTLSKIKESKEVNNGMKAMSDILSSFAIILPLQREILALASDADDEGTVAILSDFIRTQEKLVWMYASCLQSK